MSVWDSSSSSWTWTLLNNTGKEATGGIMLNIQISHRQQKTLFATLPWPWWGGRSSKSAATVLQQASSSGDSKETCDWSFRIEFPSNLTCLWMSVQVNPQPGIKRCNGFCKGSRWCKTYLSKLNNPTEDGNGASCLATRMGEQGSVSKYQQKGFWVKY